MVTDPFQPEDLPFSWEFRPDGGRWGPIAVPAPWQRFHPGFHGSGAYRTSLVRGDEDPFLLRFEAVATAARVFVNGHEAGAHTGAWTPFVVDITRFFHEDPERINALVVHVDQKPGHVTEGFLPTIGAAFGGIWGTVQRLREAPDPVAPTKGGAFRRGARPNLSPAPEIRVEGTRVLCDGLPLALRGMLHWGYYPEFGAPMPSRDVIDDEIAAFKALGFNMIKFCLFFPPERYLDACDEAGMWAWLEYPVWNRPLRDEAVLDEFEEFLRIDSRHPSVIVRTLTCENDHVDDGLARRACVLAKRYAPQGLVLDNSGWVSTEKMGDFHDEHPYLHNGEWRYYPARMRRALEGRETKPLLLGETMAVDTWTDLDALPRQRPDYHDSQRELERDLSFAGVMERSCRIARNVRKHQVETLRRDLPGVGYVMNAARDIPSAPLGFFLADGRDKFGADDFSWHRDTMVLCDLDERSFFGGATVDVALFVSHFGRLPIDGRLRCRFRGREEVFPVRLEPGATRRVGMVHLDLPVVEDPRKFRLDAVVDGAGSAPGSSSSTGEDVLSSNGWDLWAVPNLNAAALPLIDSLDDQTLAALDGGVSKILVAGPRAGSWKCPAFTWWSPVIRFDGGVLPEEFVEDLIVHDLLSGRVLAPDDGLETLLEVCDVHMEGDRVARHPLVAVTRGGGGAVAPHRPPGTLCISALRHDTPAGRYLLHRLAARVGGMRPGRSVDFSPSDSLFFREWEMSLDGGARVAVKCDTPLVNDGKTIYEGWASFRTSFEIPERWRGCDLFLRCESVADAFLLFIDDRKIGGGGNPDATWDGTRDLPREFSLRLDVGAHEIRIDARDWRGGGGMIGPVYLTRTPRATVY
jgi:hypothetical protein